MISKSVQRRIGGLENKDRSNFLAEAVQRRIGGLEKVIVTTMKMQ